MSKNFMSADFTYQGIKDLAKELRRPEGTLTHLIQPVWNLS
jgi:hypothetical protein